MKHFIVKSIDFQDLIDLSGILPIIQATIPTSDFRPPYGPNASVVVSRHSLSDNFYEIADTLLDKAHQLSNFSQCNSKMIISSE